MDAHIAVDAILRCKPDMPAWDDKRHCQDILARLPLCRFALFSCHGAASLDPWRSGLAVGHDLSKGGWLCAADLASVSLEGIDCIAFSACSSGQLAERTQRWFDDPITLASVVLARGARRALASLWPVDDQNTAALMQGVFRGALRGDGWAKSLREVKCAMITGTLHGDGTITPSTRQSPPPTPGSRFDDEEASSLSGSTHSDWASPYFWAAFELFGAP